MPETIYSQQNAFFLEIEGDQFKIREPVGWQNADISITRDLTEHGLEVEFPSTSVELEFGLTPETETGNRSKEIIDNQYDITGPDTRIDILYGLWDGVTFTEQARQLLDFSKDFSIGQYGTKVKAVPVSFEKNIRNFYNTPLNMQLTETVFGGDMPGTTPLPQERLSTHSKSLRTVFNGLTTLTQIGVGPDVTQQWFVQYGFNNEITNESVTNFFIPSLMGINDPEDDGVTCLEFNNFGQAEIDTIFLRGEFQFVKTVVTTVTIQSFYGIQGQPLTLFDSTVTLYPGGGPIDVDVTYTHELSSPAELEITPGDRLFIFSSIFINGGGVVQDVNTFRVFGDPNNACELDIDIDTIDSASMTGGHRLFEAFEYATRMLTGLENRFRSTFFSGVTQGEPQDNGGRRYFLTNGNRLRQFGNADRGVTFTMQDAFDTAKMCWAVGQAFERDGDEDVIRWERVDYFYQDHEIIDLSSRTSNYERVPVSELNINTVDVSYPKISVRETDGSNTLNAINTEISIAFPVEVPEKGEVLKSKFRTDGADIETSRRLRLKPTESFSTDDDVFLIPYINGQTSVNNSVVFDAEDNAILFLTAGWLSTFQYISQIIVTGSTFNDGTYIYQSNLAVFVPGAPARYRVVVNQNISTDEVATVNIELPDLIAERDQPFSSLIGVIDEDTIYGGRLSTLRMFVNNSLWLNAGTWYKPDTFRYQTQFKKEARNFASRFNELEPHLLGDTNRVLLDESAGVAIEDANGGVSLVRPDAAKLQAQITTDELFALIDAYKGRGPTPYGYITTIDNDGSIVEGYLLEFTMKPNTNFADLTIILRGDYYD